MNGRSEGGRSVSTAETNIRVMATISDPLARWIIGNLKLDSGTAGRKK